MQSIRSLVFSSLSDHHRPVAQTRVPVAEIYREFLSAEENGSGMFDACLRLLEPSQVEEFARYHIDQETAHSMRAGQLDPDERHRRYLRFRRIDDLLDRGLEQEIVRARNSH